MKPTLKLVTKSVKPKHDGPPVAKPDWTNDQLSRMFYDDDLAPINWTLKDALTLAAFKLLTARQPWASIDNVDHPYSNAAWAASIASTMIEEMELWRSGATREEDE